MLIAQLTDLHVRPAGHLYQGVADSNRMLSEAIRHLQNLDRRPDLVLLTGDLVDKGLPDEYAAAQDLLAALTIPYCVIPGNHDDRQNFRDAFADHAYLPAQGPLHYCIDDHPVRIIGLDSCVPGKHYGDIEPAGLRWLKSVLEADRKKPTLVMMHHPPFVCGIPYLDAYRYMEPGPLASVLESFGNIEIVVCGHVHRPMLRRWAGTIVCCCPSTTTEIALQLRPDAPSQSYIGPRGCMLHLWDEANGMISHISQIGDFAGPYPFA
jgi:3',5'-cyclic-AMP phosphodiesterase